MLFGMGGNHKLDNTQNNFSDQRERNHEASTQSIGQHTKKKFQNKGQENLQKNG